MTTREFQTVIIDSHEARFHQGRISWANGILSAPDVTYANGRSSHECAYEVLEASENALLDHTGIQLVA